MAETATTTQEHKVRFYNGSHILGIGQPHLITATEHMVQGTWIGEAHLLWVGSNQAPKRSGIRFVYDSKVTRREWNGEPLVSPESAHRDLINWARRKIDSVVLEAGDREVVIPAIVSFAFEEASVRDLVELWVGGTADAKEMRDVHHATEVSELRQLVYSITELPRVTTDGNV